MNSQYKCSDRFTFVRASSFVLTDKRTQVHRENASANMIYIGVLGMAQMASRNT
jgi:hypothetical protein